MTIIINPNPGALFDGLAFGTVVELSNKIYIKLSDVNTAGAAHLNVSDNALTPAGALDGAHVVPAASASLIVNL